MRKLLIALATALVMSSCTPPQAAVNEMLPPTRPPTTITKVVQVTTTTADAPWIVNTDVLIVGDSLAAAGIMEAIGDDLDVLWIPETGYLGGQAAASGVSSMDEADASGLLARDVYPYSGLVDEYRGSRHGDAGEYGQVYFAGGSSFGPTPLEVHEYVSSKVTAARPIEFEVFDVLQTGNVVWGVTDADGNKIIADVVVDATEFQDLYPLIEGLNWEIAACLQDTTWTVVRHEDSTLYPLESADEDVRTKYGDDVVNGWIASFSDRISMEGLREFSGWDALVVADTWHPELEWLYRGVAGGYSHVNYVSTSSAMSVEAITDLSVRETTLLEAKDRMFVYMWWQRWVLGWEGHGIATDLGYDRVDQYFWSDVIPDNYERFFAPYPYVREARTLSDPILDWKDIKIRGNVPEDPDGLLWGYFADSHGCDAGEKSSGYGLFEMPVDIYVQDDIENFYPGLARGSRVDPVVASSVRMQAIEYNGGFMLGGLILKNELPSDRGPR